MGEVVNLNRFRKQAARQEAEAKAAENRVRFGRTGAEKAKDKDEQARAGRTLDGTRIDSSRVDDPAAPRDE